MNKTKKCPGCGKTAEAVNLGSEGLFWECECGYEEAIEGTVEEIKKQLGITMGEQKITFDEFAEGIETLREAKRDFRLKTSTTWENGKITRIEVIAIVGDENEK